MAANDNNGLSAQLTKSLLALAPDFPMTAEEIQAQINERGIDSFAKNAGGHAAALAEAARLLGIMEDGVRYEKG